MPPLQELSSEEEREVSVIQGSLYTNLSSETPVDVIELGFGSALP
jgi:hypothetical protein